MRVHRPRALGPAAALLTGLVAAVTACGAFAPTRCAPIVRADGIGSCVDIRMTEEEAAYIDDLKANVPSAKDIATIQQNCDYWIEAYRKTPESMPGARAYIDKARFDECQDAMHSELRGRESAEREAELQSRRDDASRKELETGCEPGRREDLERWAAKIKTTMATKLNHRKCWMHAGLKRCDREAGFDVYTFVARRKAVGVARPKDDAAGSPFLVELEAPAAGKELHVLAFGYSPPLVRVDGGETGDASPFEDKAYFSESADGNWGFVSDVPRPNHVASRVIRSGKSNVTIDGLGCTLVAVFEGGIAQPEGAKVDDTW
jgi:hypothetical protein